MGVQFEYIHFGGEVVNKYKKIGIGNILSNFGLEKYILSE